MKSKVIFEDKTRNYIQMTTSNCQNIFALLDSEVETTPENTPQPSTLVASFSNNSLTRKNSKPKIIARYTVSGSQDKTIERQFEKTTQEVFRTKACHWVSRETPEAEYGVCTKPDCTYAHSIAELRIFPCKFGTKCNRRESDCYYIHPNESKDAFFERNPSKRPDLPKETVKTEKLEIQVPEMTHTSPHLPEGTPKKITLKVTKENYLDAVRLAVENGVLEFIVSVQQ